MNPAESVKKQTGDSRPDDSAFTFFPASQHPFKVLETRLKPDAKPTSGENWPAIPNPFSGPAALAPWQPNPAALTRLSHTRVVSAPESLSDAKTLLGGKSGSADTRTAPPSTGAVPSLSLPLPRRRRQLALSRLLTDVPSASCLRPTDLLGDSEDLASFSLMRDDSPTRSSPNVEAYWPRNPGPPPEPTVLSRNPDLYYDLDDYSGAAPSTPSRRVGQLSRAYKS
ncbi:hypothetical protein H632_c1035p1 [Helicosporidium sp. ATCC 50920]|nr:hypothetical protein H632_c1035p1 [Helicosporidium sp. ATCC 50920]|eukprot:KDD74849.1 hypothetical protein H632_c1035p1 [Helicosporidium sp. ATCC 50920]